MSDQVVGLVGLEGNIEELPDNILDIDTKSVKCFLCDVPFSSGDESFLLFTERIQNDSKTIECPLAQILSSALDVEVDESCAHSSLLCRSCNGTVLEYENVEQKLFDIRLRIITAYSRTTMHLKNDIADIANEETNFTPMKHVFDKSIANEAHENHDLTEEVVDEELNVLDSFQMLGGSNPPELDDNIKIFAVDESLSFDESKDGGIIIYEESTGGSDLTVQDEQNVITVGNDDIILSNDEILETNDNDFVSKEQNDLFSCSICDDSIYLDAKSFSLHMYDSHKLRVYPCALCNSAFQRKQELNEHITLEHSSEVEVVKLECEICSCVFENYRLYRAHRRTAHTASNKFECQECNKKYNCKTSLEEHMNMHYGLRPFQCEQCSKKFASKYALHMHLKTHGERERPHNCGECGKSFLTVQNLLHHKKIHSEKSLICELCQKSFATQHNLDAHSIVHSGKRPFACRTCGKSFARRAEVIDHERIHTGDRPFKCDMCNMAFAQRSNLTAHKKTTHYNEKQHKCEICKRSFKRRRLLDYHTQAVHTGERPYKCETCSSSFVYPEHYKKHLRIHTGLKPFACEVCEKRFSSRDNRNAHRFVHSDKKPYECVECGAGFMRKPLLLAHMNHSKHINDTIIVNQPQISGGKVRTATFTVQSDDISGSIEEYIVPGLREKQMTKSEDGKSTSERTIPTADCDILDYSEEKANDENYTVHKDSILLKSDVEDVKYLQFDDFDPGNPQALTWADLAGDKD